MSARLLGMAFEFQSSAMEKLVLLALADSVADSRDTQYLFYATLKRKTGLTREAIVDCLLKLMASGVIWVDVGTELCDSAFIQMHWGEE